MNKRATHGNRVAGDFDFTNPDLPMEERVADLISHMTLEEKCLELLHKAPGVERIGLPSYTWWGECLHGVACAGIATVFPQAIGLAAMFNEELMFKVADTISTEARAKHHEFVREGERRHYTSLTMWSPNINIFRDQRWGRGHETYGECPYLTSRLGVQFCKGLQGDHPDYLKVVATPKHYCVHSGPEPDRHHFNARVSKKDMYETYLPAFHACITEAKAHSIMGAYNRVNGHVCCGSDYLLNEILRKDWGFDGFVVSDCWAIKNFHEDHKITQNDVKSAAYAIKGGCDLNCGCIYEKLMAAVEQGLVTEEDINLPLTRLMTARMKLGMFDPPERVEYAQIPYEVNDCDEHRELAREAARQSMVLLKNDGILPLKKDINSIAVIGPNAYNVDVLRANYAGWSGKFVTPLGGIRDAASSSTKVWYSAGCHIHSPSIVKGDNQVAEAKSMARRADVAVLVLGLDTSLEGEQQDISNHCAGGDKPSLALPESQQRLLDGVLSTGTPTVVVVVSGSALDLTQIDRDCNAVIQAWYPGEEAGTAVAEVLFGDCSPAGRLPITFPSSEEHIPDFKDYSMANRTYRYLTEKPLYPFGYGLSYTDFEYRDLRVDKVQFGVDDTVTVSVTVANVGSMDGDEVVQLYVRDQEASVIVPQHDLRGFKRVHIKQGMEETVSFTLDAKAFSLINNDGKRILEPGTFTILVGGQQCDERSSELTGKTCLSVEVECVGESQEMAY